MLTIKNISKSFGDVKAVKNISFNVEDGEILGLLGPNGAGKSTTISMIATLLKPDEGVITYLGQNISKNDTSLKKDLGYVPQDIALYPTLSGLDNLKFWGNAYGIKKEYLSQRIEEVSNIIGITTRLKDKVETYSGGMKRRINIGCALLHKPKLLILDEPTVGIDPQSRRHILDSVKYLNELNTTVIYTSHYMEEVEFLCDRICIMDQGEIIAKGSKQELIDLTNIQKQIIIEVDNKASLISNNLEKLPFVNMSHVKENVITVSVKNNSSNYMDIVKVIDDSNSSLISMDIKEVDLEAVFLSLTGKKLRD
jgi:ABC-2 type transport system ATP-binding protein